MHLLRTRWAKRVVPIGVVLSLGYLTFAGNYALGYRVVYGESRGAAVALWVLSGLAEAMMLVYWVIVVAVGPGKAPPIPPFDLHGNNSSLTPVPPLFFCDEHGFPYYCSQSQSLAVPRTFFSKDLGYSTLRYDHYCVWMGTVVGLHNHVHFIKFLAAYVVYFIINMVYLIRYTPVSVSHGLNHNFIPLYVVWGMFLAMTAALLVAQVMYISRNMTTLDDITLNQRKRYNRWKHRNQGKRVKRKNMPRVEKGKRYVNVVDQNGVRVVVQYDISDNPFDLGFVRNWTQFVLGRASASKRDLVWAWVVMVVPFAEFLTNKPHPEGYEGYVWYAGVSDGFVGMVMERVRARQCWLAAYASEAANSSEAKVG